MLLLLTGGAIINVAVAWGLTLQGPSFTQIVGTTAWWDRGSVSATLVLRSTGALLIKTDNMGPDARMPKTPEKPHFHLKSVPSWSIARNPSISLDWPTYWRHVEIASGWPQLGLFCSFTKTFPEAPDWDTNPDTMSLQGGIRVSKYCALPLQPIRTGFAINTVFYAAILWMLFAALGFVRRRIRARRGQCSACAYPIGTSDVCTECGRAVGLQRSTSPQVQSPNTEEVTPRA